MVKQAPRPDHRRTPKLVVIAALTALAILATAASVFALKDYSERKPLISGRAATIIFESLAEG